MVPNMATKQKNARNKRTTRKNIAHLKASLTYVAPHTHTGRRLATRHTSHGFLLILLITVGVMLFISLASYNASGMSRSGQVNVSLTVPGSPPSIGASILTPAKKTKMKKSLATVTGICPSGTIAAVYNNGLFASSTACTAQDTFQTTIQLQRGANIVQAQNYDALNQPGPATETVEIALEPEEDPIPASVNTGSDITPVPSLPTSPAPTPPTENPCYDPAPPSNTDFLWLTTPCITRNVFVGEKLELPVTITGGLAPYALSVDWGDSDTPELYSLKSSGRHILSHTYLIPKVKELRLNLIDSNGETFQMETTLEVNDDGTTIVTTNPGKDSFSELTGVWLEASVPVYWAAVTLFAGFWVGDLFQRFIGIKNTTRRRA